MLVAVVPGRVRSAGCGGAPLGDVERSVRSERQTVGHVILRRARKTGDHVLEHGDEAGQDRDHRHARHGAAPVRRRLEVDRSIGGDPEDVRVIRLEGEPDQGPSGEAIPLLDQAQGPVGGDGPAADDAVQRGGIELPVRADDEAADWRAVPERRVLDGVPVARVDLDVGEVTRGEGAGERDERVASLVRHTVGQLEDVARARVEQDGGLEHDGVAAAGGVDRRRDLHAIGGAQQPDVVRGEGGVRDALPEVRQVDVHLDRRVTSYERVAIGRIDRPHPERPRGPRVGDARVDRGASRRPHPAEEAGRTGRCSPRQGSPRRGSPRREGARHRDQLPRCTPLRRPAPPLPSNAHRACLSSSVPPTGKPAGQAPSSEMGRKVGLPNGPREALVSGRLFTRDRADATPGRLRSLLSCPSRRPSSC